MSNEEISSVLNRFVNKLYPKIGVEIYVTSEPQLITFFKDPVLVYNVGFELPWEEYDKAIDGVNKPMWDNIKEIIKDFFKMMGMKNRVYFYYNRKED